MSAEAVAAFEAGLDRIGATFAGTFERAQDEHQLRAANARVLGPQGELTLLLKQMGELPGDRRRDLGQRSNQLKNAIQTAFQGKLDALEALARQAELSGPGLDFSLPGRRLKPLMNPMIIRMAYAVMGRTPTQKLIHIHFLAFAAASAAPA
jgi:phenylalanyl-tRNA synthetase alpha chain